MILKIYIRPSKQLGWIFSELNEVNSDIKKTDTFLKCPFYFLNRY